MNRIESCNNYYCEGFKDNLCARALEHRRKLYEKKLDDVCVTPRSNTKLCELYLEKDTAISRMETTEKDNK
jgi:hypothetical protein